MDVTLFINATIRFIETRVKEKIEYLDLQKTIGYSYRYIREKFQEHTKISLKRYITIRKLSYIAFEIETTNQSLLTLATKYQFDSYDTFTRSFQREIGMLPSQYRNNKVSMITHKRIAMGTYAPVLSVHPVFSSLGQQDKDRMLLYGVQPIDYRSGKGTPFAACLESVLAYMGQRDRYQYSWLLGASGMALRTCWKPKAWDMSNSNIANVYMNPWQSYQQMASVAGRELVIMEKEEMTKENCFQILRSSINEGKPVLVIGVVGPPETCIITGYNQVEQALYGWSFFQDHPEFSKTITIDESGYFKTSNWWENLSAILLLSKEVQTPLSLTKVLENTIAMKKR